jgi:hypothetical protein
VGWRVMRQVTTGETSVDCFFLLLDCPGVEAVDRLLPQEERGRLFPAKIHTSTVLPNVVGGATQAEKRRTIACPALLGRFAT